AILTLATGNGHSELAGRVSTTTILLGWATPPAFSTDEWAVRGAVGVVGDGESARLRERLVTQLKLATSADCTYRPLRLASIVVCEIDVADGIDPAKAEEAAFATVDQLAAGGCSQGEFERALTVWRSKFMEEMEGVRNRSVRLAWYALLT